MVIGYGRDSPERSEGFTLPGETWGERRESSVLREALHSDAITRISGAWPSPRSPERSEGLAHHPHPKRSVAERGPGTLREAPDSPDTITRISGACQPAISARPGLQSLSWQSLEPQPEATR